MLTQLSEQALVDCSWGYGNNGCDGGESERAYQWMIDSGCIPIEDGYEGGRYLMEVRYVYMVYQKYGYIITSREARFACPPAGDACLIDKETTLNKICEGQTLHVLCLMSS